MGRLILWYGQRRKDGWKWQLHEKIASEGMSVVLVGRREEKLQELGKNISETYGVDHMVIRADFAQSDCTDKIFEATKDLDMGFMSYVACFHTFGKLQDTPWGEA